MDTDWVNRYIIRNLNGLSGLRSLATEFHSLPEGFRNEFRSPDGIHFSKFIIPTNVERLNDLPGEIAIYWFEIWLEAGFSLEDGRLREFKRVTAISLGEYSESGSRKSGSA